MKKIILALLLVSSLSQAGSINPKEPGPFEPGRLITQDTSGAGDKVITDLKTGCQYLVIYNGGARVVLLGCSPEYISDKFKK